uniref:Component of oligomeric golgi complex 3 n=1 Tax=Aquila chrysaetos chrysaetos TaxID=223781 RepID=A0A663FFP9_AQUCH
MAEPPASEPSGREVRDRLCLWDRRPRPAAPLSDRQTDSVLELKAAAENLPVPAELPIEDLCSLTSQSLTVTLTAAVPESTEDVLLKGFAILGMEDERIETAQQFFSWFAQVQTQMDQDEGAKYRYVFFLSSFHCKQFQP